MYMIKNVFKIYGTLRIVEVNDYPHAYLYKLLNYHLSHKFKSI
jgi:hypothetical protein